MNTIWKKTCAKVRNKIVEEKGVAGIIFALAAVPAFALVGSVMDYMNVLQERDQVQSALDAGTLASLNLENFQKEKVQEAIKNYLEANYNISKNVELNFDKLSVSVSNDKDSTGLRIKKVTATIPAKVKTPFMKLIGLDYYSFTVRSEAKVGSGGLEVVLVLDNTGSMSWSSPAGGSKIEELKKASKALLNKLEKIAKRPNAKIVKVGIVPFSTHVMIGKNSWKRDWLDHNGLKKSEWDGALGVRNPDEGLDIIDGEYKDYPIPAVKSGVYQKENGKWKYVHKGKDKMPTVMLGLQNIKKKKASLIEKIDSMEPDGWTYIPGGLVWGWRVLSKKKPYVRGTSYSYANSRGIKKVIVLMTDGANTCDYHKNGYLKCGSGSGRKADDRLKKLCENIKAKNIGIITVAFAVKDSNTEDMLRECSNMGFYTPETGELESAFEDIGNKLISLHLSM